MRTEPFDFTTPDGRHVNAVLDRPDGQARGFALFAHCFTCGKDNLAATRISRALATEGVGTLRLDFAGIGEMGMAAMPAGFTVDVADLIAAGEHMTAHGCAPGLLIGHSLGGAAAIAAAGRMPTVRCVATIGAPFDVEHVLKLLGPEAEGLKHGETHTATVAGKAISVGAGFAESLKTQDQATRLKDLKRALLILHSPIDQIVGIEELTGIYLAARHPKSFVSLGYGRPPAVEAEGRGLCGWGDRGLGQPLPGGDADADGDRAGRRRRAGGRDRSGQVPGQDRSRRRRPDGRRADLGRRHGVGAYAL